MHPQGAKVSTEMRRPSAVFLFLLLLLLSAQKEVRCEEGEEAINDVTVDLDPGDDDSSFFRTLADSLGRLAVSVLTVDADDPKGEERAIRS